MNSTASCACLVFTYKVCQLSASRGLSIDKSVTLYSDHHRISTNYYKLLFRYSDFLSYRMRLFLHKQTICMMYNGHA